MCVGGAGGERGGGDRSSEAPPGSEAWGRLAPEVAPRVASAGSGVGRWGVSEGCHGIWDREEPPADGDPGCDARPMAKRGRGGGGAERVAEYAPAMQH